MNTETERQVYHTLNLPIEKLREYNIEKYHFLSGILDILILHLEAEKRYNLNEDDIFRHFQNQNLKFEKEREKFNAAIAQLVGSGMIKIDDNGIVRMTNEGIDAYNCQLFHGIAANLYAADRSNYLAKVAIIAASVLAVISIICTIIAIICNSQNNLL